MFQGPDVSALKLVAHRLVMHSANTDNKKLHSSRTFAKTVLCPPHWSHWTAKTPVKLCLLSVNVQDSQEGKRHCFMFIAAASPWTKQRSLYAALTKTLVHSPLINAVQASVEQNSCLSLK